jgi:O-antigen/teichoic acid export membrane protein
MKQSDPRAQGLPAILTATAVAGVVGYAIQLTAPRFLPPEAYVSYAVFWSTLYLGGAAISGVQQELARATHPRDAHASGGRTLTVFTVWSAVIVGAVAVLVGLAAGVRIVPDSGGAVAVALTVGFVGYLATSVLSGLFYGLHLWNAVAFSVIADAIFRAALVITGLILGWTVPVLSLVTAIPFGVAAGLAWIIFRRRVRGGFRLDVDLRALSAHSASTVLATTASGVMISGLPMLIGLTSAAVSADVTGSVQLAVTITRAPIVIPIIALQSFLISAVFRGAGLRPDRLLRIVGLGMGAGVLLSAAGWFIGPPIVAAVSGSKFSISGADAALIVLSAVLVAAMCVTGPALIVVKRHRDNLAGWIVAAGLTIGILMLPISEIRILLALTVAPAAGLSVHAISLVRHGSDPLQKR